MLLEEENAIEAIENLQYHENNHLGRKATEAADLYYAALNDGGNSEEGLFNSDTQPSSDSVWRG